MARDAGAKKVIMASCAPPIRYSNVYGIDMPSRKELVAYGRTVEQVAEYIQADKVIYQTLEDLIDSVQQFNPELKQFDCSVFDGHYVTGDVDAEYIEHLEHLRSENAKLKKAAGRVNVPVISERQKKIYASRASPSASSIAGPMDGANDEKMGTDPAPAGVVVNGAGSGPNGNGNRKRRLNEAEEEEEEKQQDVGCSGPMNGADDIGLFNSWTR